MGEVFEALRIHLLNLLLNGCLTVLELQRRQGFLQIAAFWPTFVTALGDGRYKRGDRVAFLEILVVIPDASIHEVGGAYQAVFANSFLVREVMEHHGPLAQAIGSHLEAGPVQ